MTDQPQRMLDRLVNLVVAIFIGALMLYGAVQLLLAVWVELFVAMMIATIICAVLFWLHERRSGW